MATVKLLLEKGRAQKGGLYPLIFRIIHNRRKRVIYTSYKLRVVEFDTASERISYLSDAGRTQKEVNAINTAVKGQRKSIDTHIAELELLGGVYDVEQIISRYRIQHDKLSLLGYIDKLVKEKQERGRAGTAIAYHSTRSSLSRFLGNRHLSILKVDAIFVKDYERYLLQSGVKVNTICYYMRNFKSIYAQALADGVEPPRLSPFRAISTKPQKTVKRALSSDTICRIYKIELCGHTHTDTYTHALSRDLFMFSFLTRGMPFVDIIHLKKTSINGETITYYRQKTGQRLQVAITDESRVIIKRYETEGEYVFPMMNNTGDDDVRKIYCKYLEKTNRELKQIGKMLNISTPLTTYVARHSWATQAKLCGLSTAIISEGLGHSSEKITQIYLKEFDRSKLDDANKKIIKELFV